MRWIAIFLIRLYQMTLSRIMPPTCRFSPSCSDYMLEAIRRFGLLSGVVLGAKRVVRCHPGNPGGYDPVPDDLGGNSPKKTVSNASKV
jgi:putative membrane protein insertion efficiency factor